MSATECLRQSELFSGLTPEQVEQIVALGKEVVYNTGGVIIRAGDLSDAVMYVICSGMVEVDVSQDAISDAPRSPRVSYLVRLGQGQVFGEMALVDRGVRSATVLCVEDGTVLYAIPHQAFLALCDSDCDIGYVVMRNIAADLSFKLRLRNLQV